MSRPNKRKRATQEQMQARADKVSTYLRQGVSAAQIRAALMEQEGCSDKTARRAIQAAYDLLVALGSQSTERQRGLLFSRLDYLYGKTSMGEDKDYDQAIKVVQIQGQLLPKPIQGPSNETSNQQIENNHLSPELEQALKRANIFGTS